MKKYKLIILSFIIINLVWVGTASAICEIKNPVVKKLVENKKYTKAEKLAEKNLKKTPDDKQTYVDLAMVYIKWATKSVIEVDETALGLPPGGSGTVKLDEKMTKEAFKPAFVFDREIITKGKRVFQDLLKKWPLDRDTHFCLLDIYQQDRDFDKFKEKLEEIATLFKGEDKNLADALFSYSGYYYKKKRYDLTLSTLEILIKHFPTSVPIISSYGVVLTEIGDMKAAMGYFERAHQLNPKDLIVIGNIAEDAIYLRDFAKAENFIKKAIELEPEKKATRYFDFAILQMRNEPKASLKAWKEYQMLNKKYPDDPAWTNLARQIEKRIKEGIEDEDMFELARSFIEWKAEKYAIPLLDYLQRKHPDEAAYYYIMAQAYDSKGIFLFAKEQLLKTEESLQNKKSEFQINKVYIDYNFGRAYYYLQEYDKALERYLKVLSEDKNIPGLQYILGNVCFQLKDNKNAKHYFQQCLKMSNNKEFWSYCKNYLERIRGQTKVQNQ